MIDTPDTDSTAFKKHIPIVEQAITKSDMLICVFDAENPKRRDHVDFLASYIRKFSGESLVCVLNKCDRLDEPELKNQIVPDFLEYIRLGWQMPADRVFCISARRNLKEPDWDETAGPRHDFDEFEDLKQLVLHTINRSGFIVDRRLENAKRLRDFVYEEAGREVIRNKAVLVDAAGRIFSTRRRRPAKTQAQRRQAKPLGSTESHRTALLSLLSFATSCRVFPRSGGTEGTTSSRGAYRSLRG